MGYESSNAHYDHDEVPSDLSELKRVEAFHRGDAFLSNRLGDGPTKREWSSAGVWKIEADTGLEIVLLRDGASSWRVGAWSPLLGFTDDPDQFAVEIGESIVVSSPLPRWLETLKDPRFRTRSELERVVRETHRRARERLAA